MEREALESIGNDGDDDDDDRPGPQFSTLPIEGRFAGNRRSFLTPGPHHMMQRDMESEIHEVERAAYGAVLRAFRAQSDELTWEKEGLITELRKELRISDNEHRELRNEVNADDLVHIIREFREGTGHQNVANNIPRHANNQVISTTVSASRKRPRTSLSRNSFGTPSRSFPRQGPTSGTGGRRPNAVPHEVNSLMDEDSISSQGREVSVPNPGRGSDMIKDLSAVEIFHTGALVKKVKKLLDASNPDGLEFKKTKKLLKEHEQTLVQVIAKLAEACDSDGEHPFIRRQYSSGRQSRVGYLDSGHDA